MGANCENMLSEEAKHTKPHSTYFIDRSYLDKYIHRDRRQIVVPGPGGGVQRRLLSERGVFLQGDKNIWELNRGGGCTTL